MLERRGPDGAGGVEVRLGVRPPVTAPPSGVVGVDGVTGSQCVRGVGAASGLVSAGVSRRFRYCVVS
jgi:hypothetical protein